MSAAPRIPKSAVTRQRILDAAAKVFREQGYSSARLVDIADLAGMKTGSLYYHFASREELVAEILHLGIDGAFRHVRDAVDALPPTADPLQRLETAVRAHTMAVLELSDYSSAQARIVGEVPADVAAVHRVEQRRYGDYWHELLLAARSAGRLRPDVDLFTARMLAFGAMNWAAEWFRPTRGPTAAAVADEAVAMVLHGIGAPSPSPVRRRAHAPRT